MVGFVLLVELQQHPLGGSAINGATPSGFKRLGVAGAVLQTPLINCFGDPFPPNRQNVSNHKPLEVWT